MTNIRREFILDTSKQDFTQGLKFLGVVASAANISLCRTLGIIGLLNDLMLRSGQGARAADQALKTISTEAGKQVACRI